MAEYQTPNGGRSGSRVPTPQRASGTVRRSDLRKRAPRQTPVGWPLIVAGLAIGVLALAWVVAGRSPQQVAGNADASGSPRPTTAIAVAPTLTSPAVAMPSPILPTIGPSPTAAPTIAAATAQPTPRPTRRPTARPTEIPRPTQPPPTQPASLTIVFPADGEVLRDREFNVIGTAPPGATVTRDIPFWFDDHLTVREDGNWLMPISLGEGENVLRFRIGDDRSTEQVVTVTYRPRT